MLKIETLVLGAVQTNTYLVCDTQTGQTVVIDPAWDGEVIVSLAQRKGWIIREIWLTHAHFDHLGGVASIIKNYPSPLPVALHPDDLSLWRMEGGAPLFGMSIDVGPEPEMKLTHGQKLPLGEHWFEVRHTPGHTQGHVVFYSEAEQVVFCGDLLFESGIGRTDLPGGNYQTLIASIHEHILSLPDDTRLLSGHGAETTVGRERNDNPFLNGYY